MSIEDLHDLDGEDYDEFGLTEEDYKRAGIKTVTRGWKAQLRWVKPDGKEASVILNDEEFQTLLNKINEMRIA